jgi:hypothetical protein
MFSNVTSPLSTHDVNRLAPASIDVSQRHADNPAIASHAPKIVPAANEVLSALVDLEELKIDQVKLVARSSAQTAVLNGVMLEWSGVLARDIEGFDIGAFARDASLTFDVLRKAIGLRQIVENKGADLPYREVLLTELSARIDSTSEADTAAKAARVAVQQKQQEIRESSARFHKELVSFRRTLRGALGSRHFDYQRLRVTKRAAEPPDQETEAPETAPSEVPSEGTTDPDTTA